MINLFIKGKMLFMLLAITGLSTLQAQDNLYYFQEANTWEFGPRIGFSTSMINSTGDPNIQRGIKLGLVGGVFARYQLAEQWAINSELSYSTRGNKSESGNFENSYIDFSIVATRNVKYQMFGGDHTFDFFIGPGISFLTNGQEKDNNIDTTNSLSSTEFNIVIGGSLPFGPILLTATNRVGMTDLLANPNPGSTWAGFTTEWTVAYRFK